MQPRAMSDPQKKLTSPFFNEVTRIKAVSRARLFGSGSGLKLTKFQASYVLSF